MGLECVQMEHFTDFWVDVSQRGEPIIGQIPVLFDRIQAFLWQYYKFLFRNNLDGCTNGIACPIPQGNQVLKVTIDFSKFQAIINLLKNDAPYQLQITLTDKATNNKIVVTAQARAEIN